MNRTFAHPFHLVDCSPWPFLISLAIFTGAIFLVSGFHHLITGGISYFVVALSCLSLILFVWWRDVIRESKGGYHTTRVQRGILIGFILFLLSEIMLFVSLFWAFFHSSLSPNIELAVWPPVAVNALDSWAIPLLGSTVLLASGFILTLGHHALILGNKTLCLLSFIYTVLFGALFLFLQLNEYLNSEFTIADSVFGSVFYMTTGLHAIHVIAGVLFLTVATVRIAKDSYTSEHHLG